MDSTEQERQGEEGKKNPTEQKTNCTHIHRERGRGNHSRLWTSRALDRDPALGHHSRDRNGRGPRPLHQHATLV
ncbi:similar to empty spiracles-like protein 2 (predicted), isoform CRA_b [Rattus norvegicus]|uniref:Similar to empty spiracles-like protein 2 (Predicted), isoform CRA_b n=1 Tax=Rattus norvegicus TaxID=10116 RepID=A6JI87_RAT|nr:similar to empty spiracles-like protein 2 (predicted), isoform CRA_b [Rattus norvegicus]